MKKKISLFSIHDPLGSTLLTRLILKFSHQNESKFRYGFDNTINAVCTCGAEVETTEYFLL